MTCLFTYLISIFSPSPRGRGSGGEAVRRLGGRAVRESGGRAVKGLWAGAVLLLLLCLSSCRTSAPPLDYRALVRAADRLEMDIGPRDNPALYLEVASWVGTPYRSGGQSRRGTDCSGFVRQVYQKVYGIDLPRSTAEQVDKGKRVRRHKLREGDLVFFHGRRKRRANHVGIYLKDGRFIHASTSRGVIVSRLDEDYWDEHWLRGRRVK